MPVGKGKITKEVKEEEEPENQQFEEFSEKIYSMVLELTRNMDEVLEKLETLTEKPKPRLNTNPEATYANKRNAYIKKLNEGAILQPKPETMEYYKVVKDGDKYV